MIEREHETPFEKWWREKFKTSGDSAINSMFRDVAHAAWLAALEHARELMREEETE